MSTLDSYLQVLWNVSETFPWTSSTYQSHGKSNLTLKSSYLTMLKLCYPLLLPAMMPASHQGRDIGGRFGLRMVCMHRNIQHRDAPVRSLLMDTVLLRAIQSLKVL